MFSVCHPKIPDFNILQQNYDFFCCKSACLLAKHERNTFLCVGLVQKDTIFLCCHQESLFFVLIVTEIPQFYYLAEVVTERPPF